MSEDTTQWTEVLSSRVSKVGYDSETLTLFVVWARGGKVSAYHNVPPDVADEFAKSWSVGLSVNSMLSGYEMNYV